MLNTATLRIGAARSSVQIIQSLNCWQLPNQVWSWDITKLKGPVKWIYFYLYVIMDIFSRYIVGRLGDGYWFIDIDPPITLNCLSFTIFSPRFTDWLAVGCEMLSRLESSKVLIPSSSAAQ